MGKIKLKCQIGDLRSEVRCYIIDADTSYNLLLGWSWIHRNSIIPSTLHQVMKYIDGDEKVRMLIAERHPFKGVENFSVFASDSVLSDTSTDVDDDPWSAIDALTSLHVPIRSSLTAYHRQWRTRILLWGPSKTQRSKTDPFRKGRVQIDDLWRLRKRDWTSSIL